MFGIATGLLVASLLLLVRQRYELKHADPLHDTGLSFGLFFLKYTCIVTASVWSVALAWLLVLRARMRKQSSGRDVNRKIC